MEFFSFIIMIIFAIVANYANDKADIGEEEHITFNPTTKHLFEEGNTDYYDVDNYIKKHIIPTYKHQELYYRIKNYQNSEDGCGISVVITGIISAVNAFIFVQSDIFNPTFAYIISLIINIALYFLVFFLYHYTFVFKRLKLTNYSTKWDGRYDEYYYKYLKDIEESVMFRYFLRKILGGIAAIICLLNIWSSDIY